MITLPTLMIFAFVFLFLLGFFPLIYYIVSASQRMLARKRAGGAAKPGRYDLAKLREVRESRIKI